MSEEKYIFPLSFAQQRLWFLDQLAPGNPFYNIPAAFRFSFALSAPVLERCLNEIVRRHESLRTTFQVQDDQPRQVVVPEVSLPLPVVDLRNLPKVEREAEALRLANEEARRGFDLKQGPLIRTTLLRLGEVDYVFLLTLHHIVSDGWSMAIFSRELTALYTAFALGRPSPLPELPIQYADFAVWQRDFLRGDRLEPELAWWKQRLAGLPLLQLPTDRPRPAAATYEGATHTLTLPGALCATLRGLSLSEGVTLFMTLLAAFQVLLHRYTRQEDIVVGVPTAGRNRMEIEGLIGFFVNTLVLRADLSGDPTFRQLLGRVRQITTEVYAHQDVPFEKLVEELEPQRDLSRNPLFQVIFQLFSNLALPAGGAPAAASTLGVQRSTAVFDLAFNLWEGSVEITGQIEYSTALYNSETIERMAGHFRNLLEGIAAQPDQPISRLPLLSLGEARQLLIDWNQTATDYPRQSSVHELFAGVVQRAPDAIALEFEGLTLTYAQLEGRANRLAHYLQSLGVGNETVVGLCLERSFEMIVALVAVLKAGGAYLPLDPCYPEERLNFMLADSGAPVVLTVERWAGRFANGASQVVCLDREAEAIARQSGASPASQVTAENLAYLMYTSGSTGKPKGAAIPHRGVVRLVRNTNYVSLTDKEVLLQFAPLAFDASTFEIWGALLNGARLVIFPPDAPSLEELGKFIQEKGVTTLWLTSSLFQQMVDGPLETLGKVRQLLAGGDVLPVAQVRKILSAFSSCRLINGYGPTENTTFTCCFAMTHPDAAGHAAPIGRPISNTRVYVLDSHLQPVPIGVPGELYIGGDGLARSYLARPELTAERFIRDPFSGQPEDRLYKSGDLVRYRADGNLEFLGRLDQQVKLRGYRIELGEIEAVLLQHPGLKQAAVVARPDTGGDKSIVAYVVPLDGQVTATDGLEEILRQFAQQHLPGFMVPAQFIALEALPLNANGKVDRGRLPGPDRTRAPGRAFIAPRTRVEELLAGLWRDVLGVEQAGVNDHFFADLRGHSLRATQLVSRIRDQFSVDLPLRGIFEAPTIAEQARLIEDQLLREIEALSEEEVQALVR